MRTAAAFPIKIILPVAAVFFCLLPFASADFQVPALTGPVVDDAGVIDEATHAALERGLFALREHGGSQINVLTVRSLEGLEIEQAGIKVLDQWKIGDKKTDNGVILLVAPKEHKVRVEVGRGLEGSLTDADSKRIIEESILPLFRTGDFSSGVLVGVYQISRKTDPTFDLKPYFESRVHARSAGRPTRGVPLRALLFFAILIIWLISRFGGGGGGYRRSGLFYGGWGGGGGFGGGFGGGGGGGGWSGGGGSGNGGGASGGW